MGHPIMRSVKNWIAQGFYSNGDSDVGKRLEMEGFTCAVLSRGFFAPLSRIFVWISVLIVMKFYARTRVR